MAYSASDLALDCPAVVGHLTDWLRASVGRQLRRKGAVVCVSGGIDSAVTFALCVRAFGPDRIFALGLPERDSSPESLTYARALVEPAGVPLVVEDITAALEAHGCYRERDAAFARAVPAFGEGWRAKLVLGEGLLETSRLNVYYVEAEGPAGESVRARLAPADFLQIVAASNLKQRTRMTRGYYHAERLNYALVGSHNRDEYLLGFSVRYGDIGVDCLPLESFYKVQVYELARYLGVPEEIIARTPSSDTYSAAQSQEEFFFALPFQLLDVLLYAWERGESAADAARAAGLTPEQAERAYQDFGSKVRATAHMRELPCRMED
jgi:NAD+ synthase